MNRCTIILFFTTSILYFTKNGGVTERLSLLTSALYFLFCAGLKGEPGLKGAQGEKLCYQTCHHNLCVCEVYSQQEIQGIRHLLLYLGNFE